MDIEVIDTDEEIKIIEIDAAAQSDTCCSLSRYGYELY